ncbi:MAG: helix-turn-helix domain-containing protein [Clostridia bacterium]|nr:helix-turn-helix domain-containing protein [Clostridia bacterium]
MDNKTAITKFSTRLKDLRKENSLSQSEVAQKLGIPPSTYANWEQGRREPSIADIYNIIKCMNIDANDLFDID